jgi:tRNA-specific 2-thiouridylase
MRVLAAMSGGVDSAVAAARVLDAGHDVVGVHLALAGIPGPAPRDLRERRTAEAVRDARRTAEVLGVPLLVWDLADRFRSDVIEDFVTEYGAGRTPNPCVLCNQRIKFSALLDRALAEGFDAVCTGHYARLVTGPRGERSLHRAVDEAKDQSYVLAVLTQETLRQVTFPLGHSRKADVRREAASRGLRVAAKADSTDICFIPDGDTAGWLINRLGRRPGIIEDESGLRVGTHEGAFAYTIGQRRGLRLGVPAPDGRPRYVVEIRPRTNTVVVGPRESLAVGELSGERVTWCQEEARPGDAVGVQVRAHGVEVPATVTRVAGGGVGVRLHTPLDGVAPGQTLVLYSATRVRGAAVINRAQPGTPVARCACHEHP